MEHKKQVRVLIIDDSAFIRQVFGNILRAQPGIEVAGYARDGGEGLTQLALHCPDVVTLDLEMPNKDGFFFLQEMMEKQPTPAIVVSAWAKEGAEQTLKALQMGAVDFVTKPGSRPSVDIYSIQDELVQKVQLCSRIRLAIKLQNMAALSKRAPSPLDSNKFPPPELTVIGCSTGGPKALDTIIADLGPNYPTPIVVAQHMPVGFTEAFARRLNSSAKIPVKEAQQGEELAPGRIYIGPAGLQTIFERKRNRIYIKLAEMPGRVFRPSVDVMFHSAAEVCGKKVLALLMTGMGSDGAKGLKTLHDLGAWTIAESEETCIIYGMPRVAIEMGGAREVLPLTQIADALRQRVKGI
ncbi:MAG: protein-glutamate methylesterase/protein-glutamine glutaminase [Bacillota bacterium]